MHDYRFRMLAAIDEVPAGEWDALTDGQPVLSHAFLSALERTGCVGPRTGWEPRHAILRDGGELVAAMPLYEKRHSWGEYVFDWAWAEAYARHGLEYYPKWLGAIPFSPIPGSRLLGRDDAARRALLQHVLRATEAEARVSSLHLLFPTATEAEWMKTHGMLIRQGVQFHWLNAGYRDFEDFLAGLRHDKRKKIRQERRRADALGLSYRWEDGGSASERDWRFFYRCYANTYALHGSSPYLSAAFFAELATRAPQSVRLLLAEREGEAVASAFFLCDAEALYGRYWGATEHLPFLHFELCYYRAIDWCIATGRRRFEGGAQGEHKLARGLQAIATLSAHWLRDARFHDAVDRYLEQESAGIGFYLDELAERAPFRREPE